MNQKDLELAKRAIQRRQMSEGRINAYRLLKRAINYIVPTETRLIAEIREELNNNKELWNTSLS
jgi:hypothetical protein